MVGVLLPNCPEYAVVVLGTLHAGLTITTMNPIYTPHELAHQLNASKAKVLVTSYELLDKVTRNLVLGFQFNYLYFVTGQ